MFRQKSVDVHQFSMVPRADIPRSAFNIQTTHKTTFDAGYLIPVYVDEVLPGDSFSLNMTAFARMATPLYPVMDNLHLDSFFFFIPNRLVWDNWVKFMGEQANPADSISYTIPQQVCPAGGYAIGSLQDYMGLPTVGQVGAGNTVTHSALPLRAYNLVYNEFFRDQNLVNSVTVDKGDGPDNVANYVKLQRLKRHDYFTSALPWPLKGGVSVSLPLGTSAPVRLDSNATGAANRMSVQSPDNSWKGFATDALGNNVYPQGGGSSGQPHLFADLSAATAATVNQLRQSFQIQKLLERDARGGTRYVESLRAHFGVTLEDYRAHRPVYLGGSSSPITINPIAQTSATGLTGGSTPVGTLAAMGTALASGHGFTQAFSEHGIILGLVCVRADLTYQQGLRRFWSRSTRYDFYYPEFAALGEQTILNKEIYCDGSANDANVFGYAERWAELRYFPAMITSLFRSTAAGTIDAWHLAQKFTSLPTLGSTFIKETPPLSRILAVGASANGQQILFDSFFNIRAVRPMPLYSVPGLIDHF